MNQRRQRDDQVRDKENMQHLPVFYDSIKSGPSMIPRVETDGSGSAAGLCRAILSDLSDEQIARTLKLNFDQGAPQAMAKDQYLNLPLQMNKGQDYSSLNSLSGAHNINAMEMISNQMKVCEKQDSMRQG